MRVTLRFDLRPAEQAEPPNGGRRKCGEPSVRMRAPAPEGDMRQHVATRQ
jgi:hypothetical protein